MTPSAMLGLPTLKSAGGTGPFDLRKIGVIPTGELSSPKARIMLMVLQAAGLAEDAICKEFAEMALYLCP